MRTLLTIALLGAAAAAAPEGWHTQLKDGVVAAKKSGKPVFVARKFEKRAFNHKDLAAAAKGWKLVRLDLANDEHAQVARGLAVTEAPALLMFLPGEEKPKDLGRIKAASLVYYLKKSAPK